MNNSPKENSYLLKMLQRTGGWYPIIAIIITQIFSDLGTIAADYSVHVNAEFSPTQLASLTKFIVTGTLTTNLLLLVAIYYLYGDVREKLDFWKKGENLLLAIRDDIKIWNQITSLAWRYSLLLFITNIFTIIIPLILFQIFILKVESAQVIYTLLGSFAALLGTSTLSLLLLDYFLKPTYAILLPQNTGKRHIRTKGVGISIKLQSVILALILMSILMIAPIGYHQTVKALETGNPSVLRAMQSQSLVVSILTILFGILLSALYARTISSSLQELIGTFTKIEAGDLKQRAKVRTPDEIGELAIYFNNMVSRLDELQSNLKTQIELRTEQLKASSEIGRAVSSILDPDKLIEEVVNLITEHLGYYYAAIFIISPDGSWAELKGATGKAGKVLRAKKHRFALTETNTVGFAINSKETYIADDIDFAYYDNPLLSDTRSEIALPLIVGENVLGALNVQSTEKDVFDEEIAEILQGMTNQVAVAIENARLFQKTQDALDETRFSQQTQLSKAWAETLDAQGDLAFSIGQEPSADSQTLNAPLALRDQIIGEITLEGSSEWTSEEQDWVEAVATQATIALENARLLEESQRIALQERLVAEITSKIWSSNTIDGILKVTLKELGNTLGASAAMIKLDIDNKQEA